MRGSDYAIIAVALISVLSAMVAARTARSTAKTQAETEAYARARKMDVETIERQDEEIEEIRKNNRELRDKVRKLLRDNEALHQENADLRSRVSSLERVLRKQNG
jgi:FtsZ-binding cell division protein ZapB